MIAEVARPHSRPNAQPTINASGAWPAPSGKTIGGVSVIETEDDRSAPGVANACRSLPPAAA
jgi:hypothetical protein